MPSQRIRSKIRCPRCRMSGYLCLCAELPHLALATRLVVLMHYREQATTSNTARLACLALSNSSLHLRGRAQDDPNPEALVNNQPLAAADLRQAILLYPSPHSQELTAESAALLPRPLTLVVPDGSWRQARKMANREPALVGLPHFRLPPGPPSNYRLRTAPQQSHLSTFEAIARALGVLEGPATEQVLLTLFAKMIERTLWSKSLLTPDACQYPIPEQALRERAAGGRQGDVHADASADKIIDPP